MSKYRTKRHQWVGRISFWLFAQLDLPYIPQKIFSLLEKTLAHTTALETPLLLLWIKHHILLGPNANWNWNSCPVPRVIIWGPVDFFRGPPGI